MTKTERLKKAYADLQAGKMIEFIPDKTERNRSKCACAIVNSEYAKDRRKYIAFRCAGSSARRLGLNNLRWIAKNIGSCTTYEYTVTDSWYSMA